MEIRYSQSCGTPNATKSWIFELTVDAFSFYQALKKELLSNNFIYRRLGDSNRFYLRKTRKTKMHKSSLGIYEPSFKLKRSGCHVSISWYSIIPNEGEERGRGMVWSSFSEVFESLDDTHKKVLAFHMDIFV